MRRTVREVSVTRHIIEAAALILWPLFMILARGYGDAGTIFGDAMVAGLGIICAECMVRWSREGREDDKK